MSPEWHSGMTPCSALGPRHASSSTDRHRWASRSLQSSEAPCNPLHLRSLNATWYLQDHQRAEPPKASDGQDTSLLNAHRDASQGERVAAWRGVGDALKGWEFPHQEPEGGSFVYPEEGASKLGLQSTKRPANSRPPLSRSYRNASPAIGEGIEGHTQVGARQPAIVYNQHSPPLDCGCKCLLQCLSFIS